MPPRPGCRSLIWFLPVLVTAAGLFGLVGQAPVLASTLPAQPAVVFSGGAAPDQLPASGGTIAITGKVGNALSCQLQLLSRQSFSVVFSHNPRNCSAGDFSARVTIGPNNTTVQRTVAFALVASNHSSASTGRFYVLMAGAKPAAVLSVGAAPDNLPAGGGTVAVGGKVGNAVQCQLQLLSKQSFPVVYSHNARTCSNGDYSAHITIGPNTTTVQRTIAFSLVASGKVTVSTGKFYVLLAAAHAPVTTTTAPPTTTTLPPTTKPSPTTTTTVPPVTTTTAPRSGLPGTTTVPTASSEEPVAMQSSNWSGYAAVGGPYSVIKGTFTVPGLSAGTSLYDQVSEWVGIDGANGSDAYLIQAGVDEYANPDGSGFEVQPWWEILPAAETNITTVSVSAGDTVSVTIWQVSGTDWEVNLTDDTTGKSFTSPGEQYNGPGSTAEWVVEATTRCRIRCETTELAPYSPRVAFSNLGMTGPEGSLDEITMVQGGESVSTPSALSSGAFNVTYTGMQLSGGFVREVSGTATKPTEEPGLLPVVAEPQAPPGRRGPETG